MSDEFKLGFRISIFDICILVAGSVFAAFLFHKSQILFGLIVALVVGHFFLFCNVFRICRRSELIWATAFVLLSIGTSFANLPSPSLFAVYLAFVHVSIIPAADFIIIETRKPSYHGIFWKKWNPNLKSWWKEQSKTKISLKQ